MSVPKIGATLSLKTASSCAPSAIQDTSHGRPASIGGVALERRRQ
jgi:hypothetical protein